MPKHHIWSIGMARGPTPLDLRLDADQPVLRADHVFDVEARFVADPFLVRSAAGWSMFFEVLEDTSEHGLVGVATSVEGRVWNYEGIVLREPFHLSYPMVFAHAGEHWMVPETLAAGAIRLYRAQAMPGGWRHELDLVEGEFADPTLAFHRGRWWLFACARPFANDVLRLWSAAELAGPWLEHPRSPVVVGDARHGRQAGRIIEWRGRLIRWSQDCSRSYGEAVVANEILVLDEHDYLERELATVFGPGRGWNAQGMHQLDAVELGPDSWMACVDGQELR